MEEKEKLYSFLGFFMDEVIEDDFQQFSFRHNLPQIRSIFLYTGLAFFLLIFPDLFMMREFSNYWITGSLRFIFLLLSLYLAFKKSPIPSLQVLNQYFTIHLSLGFLFSLFILLLYDHFYFASISFGILFVVLYLFFIIPLPLKSKNILVILLVLGFIIISLLHHRISPIELTSFTLVIVLTLFFFNYIIAHINQIQREKYLSESKLVVLNKKDPLTGIANRLKFNEFMEDAIPFAKRYRTPLTLVLLKIEGLQAINNKYGQGTGDEALKELTHLLLKNIREVDFLARVGGDDFTLTLPNTSLENGNVLMLRVKEKIDQYFAKEEKKITINYGLATYQDNDTFISFIKRADTALFRAKKEKQQMK